MHYNRAVNAGCSVQRARQLPAVVRDQLGLVFDQVEDVEDLLARGAAVPLLVTGHDFAPFLISLIGLTVKGRSDLAVRNCFLCKKKEGEIMLSLTLAQQLKAAGLPWTPAQNDFFAVPDRGLDDVIFVISDMTVLVEKLGGQMAVTFHGVVEWALDHILIAELVWLPSETQLREALEQRLIGEVQPALSLVSTPDGYRAEIRYQGQTLTFEAFGVSEVYGTALLHLLENES